MRAELLAWVLLGCSANVPVEAGLDEAFFRCRVQPILTRSCGALACHGDGRRPFAVFSRSRLRLGGDETERNVFLRAEEARFNFESSLAMVDLERPDQSPLLRKPLAEAAGGWFHRGARLFDQETERDVYTSEEDTEFQVLRGWVAGEVMDPTCIEPGSDR